MDEGIYKLPHVPEKYEFNNSYYINKFKEYNHIENLDNITIDDIRNVANKDYDFILKFIDELVLRGFTFITRTPQSILPRFSIDKNNYRYIYTDKDTEKYKKINFGMFLLGKFTEKFKIDSDLFFNYIPLEGFQYFNSNIDLDLLANHLEKCGFQILCQNEEKYDEENSIEDEDIIEIKDKLISEFLKERGIKNNKRELSNLNKNELLLIKGVGITRIGKFIKLLKTNEIDLTCNNNFCFNGAEEINKLDLSYKFKEYCNSKKIKHVIKLKHTDFIKLVMNNKMTLEDVEYLLNLKIDNEETTKCNNLLDVINQNSKSSKTINIFLQEIERNKVTKLEDFTNWDYKNFFKYNFTPMNLADCMKILELINYKYVNKIKYVYSIQDDLENIFLDNKYGKIYNKLQRLNITKINQLETLNLFLLINENSEISRVKEFTNEIFSIGEHEIDDLLSSIKEIDEEIYVYCLKQNYQSIKDINFIDIFEKFDIEKFSKLIHEIDLKYKDDNLTLFLYKDLDDIKEKNSSINLLYKRINNNYTLEKIGQELGITKERVRQRINSVEAELQKYIKTIFKIIKNYINEKQFLTQEDLEKIYPLNDVKVIKYLLINSNIKDIQYIQDLNIFTKSNSKNIQNIYDNIVKELGDVFYYYEEIDKIENVLEEEQIDYLPIEYFESYLERRGYHVINNIYCKKNSNTFLFQYIVKNYFKDGIKLDDDGIEKLKEKIREIFGNEIEYSQEAHAIKSSLSRERNIIICDNNKYIHFDNVKVDKHLINQIRKELIKILKTKENVSPHTIFNMFKKDLLEKTSINNEIFLYGILRYLYDDEFSFRRLNISKLSNDYNNLTKPEKIEEYILNKGEAVIVDEIKYKFDLNEDRLSNVIAISEKLIYWDKHKKINHIDLIRFTDEMKSIITEAIEKEMKKRKYVPVYTIYKEIELDLIENKINDVESLYNLLKIKLESQYNFKNNFILDKTIDDNKFELDYVINDYFKDFKYIERNDIVEFTQEMNFKAGTASTVISKLQKELFKIDIDTYMNMKNVNLSENETNQIKKFVDEQIIGKEYLVLKDLETKMNNLPQIKYFTWNQYSLNSIVKKVLNKYYKEVEKDIIDWRYYMPIIVRKESKIENFNDLLLNIMEKELKCKYIRVSKIKEYLIRKNIIKKEIPKDFLEDPRIEFNDGIIQIL